MSATETSARVKPADAIARKGTTLQEMNNITIRSIAILFLIGISVYMCGCLDVESSCQHEINQAVADRDDKWQQILADRDAECEAAMEQLIADRDAEYEAAMEQLIADRDAKWQQALDDNNAEWQQIIADRDAEYEAVMIQAIAYRDAQWQQAVRQSNDQQALDLIMQILPLLI